MERRSGGRMKRRSALSAEEVRMDVPSGDLITMSVIWSSQNWNHLPLQLLEVVRLFLVTRVGTTD